MNKQALIDFNLNKETVAHILNYLKFGVGVGATAAAGSTLNNFIKDMYSDNLEERQEDDDIMYMQIPKPIQKNMLQKNSSEEGNPKISGTEHAVATAGLLAGGFGSYYALKKLYTEYQIQKKQKELDDLQNFTISQMAQTSPEAIKMATENAEPALSNTAIAGSLPILLTLLLGGASAVSAYKFLDKDNPKLKKTHSRHLLPQQVRFIPPVKEEEKEEGDDLDSQFKMASIAPEVQEHLLRTVISFDNASDYDMYHVVKAASAGYTSQMKDKLATEGLEAMLDYCIDIEDIVDDSTGIKHAAACSWVSAEPSISLAVQPLLSAEFNEQAPVYFQTGRQLDEATQEQVLKAAALFVEESRHEQFAQDLEKSASEEIESTFEDKITALETLLSCKS